MWVVPAGIPSGGGYTINNAIYLDGAADYLTNTFAGAGNNKTGTISFWVKRNETGATHQLFHARSTSGSSQLNINSSNVLYWRLEDTAGGQVGQLTSTQVVRDLTAWMHVVVNFDTSNGTAGNRMRMYVNGSEVTAFSADVNPSLNADSTISDAAAHYIGATHVPDSYADCYLAEYIYIDGTQLDASSFGETDAKGNWVPVDPSGLTFGTNGFWLDFAVAPGTGNGAGTDVSGNGNHWTDTSLTASQQVEDSPTDSSADNVGNYATLNPLSNLDSSTISNGNLTLVTNSSNYAYVTSTQAMPTNSGIYWFKTTLDSMANGSTNYVGIVTHSASSTTNYLGADADAIGYRADGLTKSNGANVSTSLTTCTTNDVIYMKVDTDADTVAWYKNDTSTLIVSESIPSGAVGKPLLAAWGDQDNASTAGFTIDFGTGGFSIPDGQYLNTAKLPAPTVKDPDDGFALITLESGTTIEASLATARTGWGSYIDVFRREDGTAEDWDVRFSDDSGNSMHFNSNAAAGAEATLASGVNYSAWSWRVGSTYGCYTAEISHTNGSATNQAHSLGSGVKSAIAKRSDSTGDWYVSHPDMASANLRFNVQDTPTTSELVTVDGTNVTLDSTLATGTYRVIVFEQIEGFSSFVGYDHNGSSDGPYVNLGGSASLVLWRNIDATNYNDFFSTFTTYTTNGNGNPTDYRYNWRGTAAGASGITIGDVTANGYKMRPSTGSAFGSASGDPMLVWAWGLRPFGGSGVAQARAR